MATVIHQKVVLTAPPEAFFEIYMNPKRHAAAIGAKVRISGKAGRTFSAFDGGVTGRTLMVVPKRLIVQAWRGEGWKPSDPDSILILMFSKTPRGGQIELIHANVPAHQYAIISKGWRKHYWKPWKTYLQMRRSR